MQKIPLKLRSEMSADPFYKRCCITGRTDNIQWHHAWIWKNSQLQEKWAILPVCEAIHILARRKDTKEKLDWIALNRADDATLRKYSKAEDLIKKRDRLNQKYA